MHIKIKKLQVHFFWKKKFGKKFNGHHHAIDYWGVIPRREEVGNITIGREGVIRLIKNQRN